MSDPFEVIQSLGERIDRLEQHLDNLSSESSFDLNALEARIRVLEDRLRELRGKAESAAKFKLGRFLAIGESSPKA